MYHHYSTYHSEWQFLVQSWGKEDLPFIFDSPVPSRGGAQQGVNTFLVVKKKTIISPRIWVLLVIGMLSLWRRTLFVFPSWIFAAWSIHATLFTFWCPKCPKNSSDPTLSYIWVCWSSWHLVDTHCAVCKAKGIQMFLNHGPSPQGLTASIIIPGDQCKIEVGSNYKRNLVKTTTATTSAFVNHRFLQILHIMSS